MVMGSDGMMTMVRRAAGAPREVTKHVEKIIQARFIYCGLLKEKIYRLVYSVV